MPRTVVLNGFGAGDFADDIYPAAELPLVMRYTGTLFYVGNSDPSILFDALRELKRCART